MCWRLWQIALWLSGSVTESIHGLAGAWRLLLGMHCLAAAVSSDVGMTPRGQISSYATSRNGGCWWDTGRVLRPHTLRGQDLREIIYILVAQYLTLRIMTRIPPWIHGENRSEFFLSVFFCLNREIIVNLIMMQNWRRKRRSANTIYRDIVPKEKTAFICMISFIEMCIN